MSKRIRPAFDLGPSYHSGTHAKITQIISRFHNVKIIWELHQILGPSDQNLHGIKYMSHLLMTTAFAPGSSKIQA